MSMPVALQLYSVRDDAGANFYATLKKVKEMGYDGVEFAGLYGNAPENIRKMCEELDLVPLSAHVPYYDMIANPADVFSQYAEIGCRFVAIPYLTPECRPGTDGFAKVVENALMLGKVAAQHGIRLLYHNHDFEFEKIEGKYALDLLYDTVPAEYLQTELDVCWVKVGGEDPAAYIAKYTGRAPIVHLKDYVGGKSDNMYELIGIESEKNNENAPKAFEFRPVGFGCQDMKGIINAASAAGAEWLCVEQDQPSMGLSPMECAQKSIQYLRSIGC